LTECCFGILAESLKASSASRSIENKPGASGNIGIDIVAKSAPDATPSAGRHRAFSINQFLIAKMPFDPRRPDRADG